MNTVPDMAVSTPATPATSSPTPVSGPEQLLEAACAGIEKKPGCIQATLAIIGDKWTALLLRDVAAGPCTFSDLEASLANISPRTLSQRLDKLEQEGIVRRIQYCEHPPRYRYEITLKGSALQEVLIKMAEWGERYS